MEYSSNLFLNFLQSEYKKTNGAYVCLEKCNQSDVYTLINANLKLQKCKYLEIREFNSSGIGKYKNITT